MKRLLLVRHGETGWNAQHRYQGWSDEPLNRAGLRQAQRLAERLAEETFDAVYTSDLSRATQTAEAIATRHSRAVTVDPRLREISFGEWEGLTFDEIQARWPQEVAAWIDDPLHVAPPGGETLPQMADRVGDWYSEIIQREGEASSFVAHTDVGRRSSVVLRPSSTVLVSHGGPLRALLCLALGLEVGAHWRFRVDVASLSELSVYDGGATLTKLNETLSGERKWES